MADSNITPGSIVKKLRDNMNNNGTVRSLFRSQLFGKFSVTELEGIKKSIDKEIAAQKDSEVAKLKAQLEQLGYTVAKK